ncbi:hypothetical protein CROQUDRAFT_102286 [Cronartium quercuum f. sp. fusiforme G11]|uniref:Uncharacterized protein n=1 Tax=Cronartium quercuum f. sp. fusiforme G11 TaxID=708437 RepID=A0A9P6N7E2_9BASI|nr:hypothetical protein CROQUDRAFT_102286 [Cronartium quercuum f. sp. fusiforme G11]
MQIRAPFPGSLPATSTFIPGLANLLNPDTHPSFGIFQPGIISNLANDHHYKESTEVVMGLVEDHVQPLVNSGHSPPPSDGFCAASPTQELGPTDMPVPDWHWGQSVRPIPDWLCSPTPSLPHSERAQARVARLPELNCGFLKNKRIPSGRRQRWWWDRWQV